MPAMLGDAGARESPAVEPYSKVLEDANIKLASVASDVLGASGRDMLNAIVRGECDADLLAELARKRLRAKIPELRMALSGSITDHHRFPLRQWLEMLAVVESKIAGFNQKIDELVHPFAPAVEIRISIPGSTGLLPGAWLPKLEGTGISFLRQSTSVRGREYARATTRARASGSPGRRVEEVCG
jgi:hypothetical protein